MPMETEFNSLQKKDDSPLVRIDGDITDSEFFELSKEFNDEEFSKALLQLGETLLFDTDWHNNIVRNSKIIANTGLLQDIPLICRAEKCPYAAKCPVLQQMSDQKVIDSLKGTNCRVDRIFGLKQFVSLVKNLNIDPGQTVDILNVASYVRLLMLKRRMDWDIAIEGLRYDEIAAVDQRTGSVYHKSVDNPLIKAAGSLDKQIEAQQKLLVASRKDKMNAASQLGQHQDFLKELFLMRPEDTKEPQSALPDYIDADSKEIEE